MTLAQGNELSHYTILAPLGAGAMGEVYRAKDTKLGREVAIKVLPEHFADDEERLKRFEREAQTLASLNHPNVAQIHGVDQVGDMCFLVLELVPGESLEERLKRGPLPLDEALDVCRQIAEGLEAAHEAGVIHRDLKPANIRLTPEGKVKVLDFGLAKPANESGKGSSTDSVLSTEAGRLLGTPTYMAPEQARGKSIDKRVDIWAFGCVLYECLTARRAFEGETLTDVFAAVIEREPELAKLPGATPPHLRALISRCFAKNPRQRLRDIGDARLALEDAGENAERVPAAAGWSRRLSWAIAALASVVALALGYFAARGTGAGVAHTPVSFERLTFRPGHFVNARFAPDGQTVFLSADWERNEREIFQVRPKAGELAIGIGAELLSVSRSGELAVLLPRVETGNPYHRIGTLAVVSSSGGTPRMLADGVMGADWSPDGKSLAVLRVAEGKWRLEYPLGTMLHESPRRFHWIRVSPQGDAVAFFEPDPAGRLSVVVVERSGARQVWSSDWSDWWNLAWSPDGEEVWFGASRAGDAASLYAVDRRGNLRTLLAAPGTLELHDVAPDRSVLVAQVYTRTVALGGSSGGSSERDLSWLEGSSVADLSADGRQALLRVSSEREPGGDAAYLRSMDGAVPVRLGSGRAQELSRDGKWALAIRSGAIVALPTAAGEEKVLETGFSSLTEARWMPDGIHVLVVASEPSGGSSVSDVSFEGGAARTVAAQFDLSPAPGSNPRRLSPVSPDGRLVAAAMASGQIVVLPLDGGVARPLPGSGPNDLPIQWTADGSQLFLSDASELPTRVYRVDLATGRRELWREILPLDRAGVAGIDKVVLTPDATAYAYSYGQYRSDLYLVKGLQ